METRCFSLALPGLWLANRLPCNLGELQQYWHQSKLPHSQRLDVGRSNSKFDARLHELLQGSSTSFRQRYCYRFGNLRHPCRHRRSSVRYGDQRPGLDR